MNLQHLIEHYIAFQRTLGANFQANANVLRAFGRAIGPDGDVADVRPEHVHAFLAGAGPITRTWHVKLSVVRTFFRFAVSRGHVGTAPMPTTVPRQPPPFVPYIYSQDELRRLFQTARVQQGRRTCLAPITLYTFLLSLYGAGLRLGEALNLNRVDVDLGNSVLAIRRSKFGKTKLVPVGRMLGEVLSTYSARMQRHDPEAPFFTTRTGARVRAGQVQHHFRRLCTRVGVWRADGGRFQPRLHDLRHSFAVHRLTSWYQQGADVQRLLPQLSAYLGHVEIADTQVYLTLTPALLNEAGKRFERYAQEERHHA